jgi:hypothetical protein
MQAVLFIGYLGMGVVQFFATMDGVEYAAGIGGFFNVVISFVLAYIPFIGSITGVYGAVAVWDWNLFAALALFFWMLPVGVIFAAIDAISGRR